MGLQLRLNQGEKFTINSDITITVTKTNAGWTSLTFDMPDSVIVERLTDDGATSGNRNTAENKGQYMTLEQQRAISLKNVKGNK